MSTDTLTTDPSSDSGGPNYQVRALVRGLAVLRSFRVDGNRSGGARRYAATGSGAQSVGGRTWGSKDGDSVPVRWAAHASVR